MLEARFTFAISLGRVAASSMEKCVFAQLHSMLPVSCLSAGMGTMFIERPSKAYKSEHRVTGRVDRKDFLFIGFEQKYW